MHAPEIAPGFPSAGVGLPAGIDTPPAAPPRAPTTLFVDQSGQPGGAELSLLPLAELHAAHGEVLLLADGPFRVQLEARGIRVTVESDARVSSIRRSGLRFGGPRTLAGLLRQVGAIAAHARRFDVLYLNTQKALVLGALGKPLHRRPIVWHAHDVMTREHFGRMQLAVVRWLVPLAVDTIIANSHATAAALSALTGVPVERMRVVHNGIDAASFAPAGAAHDARALRRRFGLPEQAWLAGLFGRIAPWKGQHVAIEALAQLPDAHLVVVGAPLFGENDYRQSLQALAERIGVADRVHFVGARSDVAPWMHAMDVILHTSTKPEPFGRVIIEGMAAGKPVIATAAGGVPEIVRHRENGWLVAPGNATALADAMAMLRAAPSLAARLAADAQADVRQHFSLERYLWQMQDAIARVRLA